MIDKTHKESKAAVGKRIKSIRVSLGLTMKEFGKLIDKENPASDSIVSRWEHGVSLPNVKRLKNIAESGNVSLTYLLEGKQTFEDIDENLFSSILSNPDNFKKEYYKLVRATNIDDLRTSEVFETPEDLDDTTLDALASYLRFISSISNSEQAEVLSGYLSAFFTLFEFSIVNIDSKLDYEKELSDAQTIWGTIFGLYTQSLIENFAKTNNINVDDVKFKPSNKIDNLERERIINTFETIPFSFPEAFKKIIDNG